MKSILELAQELNTSKTTINRKIRELNIKSGLTYSDGKYYLSDEQAEQIKRNMKRNKNINGASYEPQPIPRNDAQLIKKLLQQLEEKDTLIKSLQETIKRQDEQINSYLVLLAQEQQLHKYTQNQLSELQERQRKGFFARLFGKKDAPKLTDKQQEKTSEEAKAEPQG